MIPITRIDEYLAVISQDEDATGLPDQAVTRIDMYLSKIAGEAVAELPEPVTRIDRYLASIAGMDVVMDDPITRIDYYLAAVAGVYSGELPEPVTRIDHYLYQWASEPQGFLHTLTGSILHITDGIARPAQSLTVDFSPIQAGTGDPSPDNVRPISGRDSIYVGVGGGNLLTLNGRTAYDQGVKSGTDIVNLSTPLIINAMQITGAINPTDAFAAQDVVIGDNNSISLKVKRAWYGVGFNVPVTPNTTYTIKADNRVGNVRKAFYNAQSKHIGNTDSETFTTPSECAYVVVIITGGTVDSTVSCDHLRMMVGSTDTGYTDYTGNTVYPITLPSTIYGGSDEVVGGNGSETWGELELGSLYWSVYNAGFHIFSATPSPTMKGNSSYAERRTGIICSCYKPDDQISIGENMNDKTMLRNNGTLLIRDNDYSDKDVFKAAMSGVQLAYELADPVPFTTTPTEIDILEGENVLWSTGDTNTLEYWGSEPDDPQILANLNVLLGNRYYNNHTENEPTDEEALNILLGGSR